MEFLYIQNVALMLRLILQCRLIQTPTLQLALFSYLFFAQIQDPNLL